MVQRLAKGVLPPNTQIQKDAITAMSKAATVFVNYLAQSYPRPFFSNSFTNPFCPSIFARLTLLFPLKIRANTSLTMGNRKTISPEAVLDALAENEFEDFLPRVQAELRRFNEVQTGKRNEYRRKLKEKEVTEHEAGGIGVEKGPEDGDGERAAKRVRREDGGVGTNGIATGKEAAVGEEEGEEEEIEEDGGKDDTVGNEGGEEEEEEEEEEEDEGASGDERDAPDLDDVDNADLDERAGGGEEEEEEDGSSDDNSE